MMIEERGLPVYSQHLIPLLTHGGLFQEISATSVDEVLHRQCRQPAVASQYSDAGNVREMQICLHGY